MVPKILHVKKKKVKKTPVMTLNFCNNIRGQFISFIIFNYCNNLYFYQNILMLITFESIP